MKGTRIHPPCPSWGGGGAQPGQVSFASIFLGATAAAKRTGHRACFNHVAGLGTRGDRLAPVRRAASFRDVGSDGAPARQSSFASTLRSQWPVLSTSRGVPRGPRPPRQRRSPHDVARRGSAMSVAQSRTVSGAARFDLASAGCADRAGDCEGRPSVAGLPSRRVRAADLRYDLRYDLDHCLWIRLWDDFERLTYKSILSIS